MASTTVAAKQAGSNLKMLRLRRDVTISYQQLISSIVRVIDYYNSKNRDAAIDNIIITGIAADFWGFAGLLSQELGRNVEVLKDLAGTNINQGLHLQGVSLGDYISVIGAGLGSVGFMPAVEKTDKKKGGGSAKDSLSNIGNNDKLPFIVLGVGLVVGIGLSAAALVPYYMTKTENQNLQERKAQLAPVQDTYNEYVAVEADYNYIVSLYDATVNTVDDLPELIGELEDRLPTDSTVTTMTVTPENVSMVIQTSTKTSVAKAIVEYRQLPYFSDVIVNQVSEALDTVTGARLINYNITCELGYNPGIASEDDLEENTEAVDD